MAKLTGIILPAILALTLFATGGCSNAPKGNLLGDLFASFSPPSPKQAALDAFDIYDADKRRRAVALLAAAPFGGEEPYVKLYRFHLGRGSDGQKVELDRDATVRATCAKALSMHGTVEDAELIVPLLKDDVAYVRWQAAMALQRIHHSIAVQPLMDTLRNDDDSDVRMASAQALGQYPEPLVFDTLVGALSDRDFGVVRAAHHSLKTLTGQEDLSSKGSVWVEWGKQNRSDLFASQQTYTYVPYEKPKSFFDKLAFWKKDKDNEPKEPIGLDH